MSPCRAPRWLKGISIETYTFHNTHISVSLKRPRPDSNDDSKSPPTLFTIQENFPLFLTVKSTSEKLITSLSPFVIERHIQGLIGTVKTVKKLRDSLLLAETNAKLKIF